MSKAYVGAAAGILIGLLAVLKWSDLVRTAAPARSDERVLRVCADPNNLPFSNRNLEGFENRLAELVAGEMNARVEYYWWAQHRGFIRHTLGQNRCDVILGISTAMDRVLTTDPYYRSIWVFVSRSDRKLAANSFDSPLLKKLRIGVHLVGDDAANTPPVHALQRRNMARNIAGFRLTGDYTQENPPADLLEAVVSGEVDMAVAWGPLAGHFALKRGVRLDVTPVTPAIDPPGLPMVYEISAGVRRNETALHRTLNTIFERRRIDIENILDAWGVPRVDSQGKLVSDRQL